MLKKINNILFVIFLSFIISCGNDKISHKKVIKENNDGLKRKILNVGIYVYAYPFGYLSDGNINGLDYDIINEIAQLNNFDVNFIGMKFDELFPALESKKVDIIAGAISIKEYRKKLAAFSTPYYSSKQVILINNDNTNIKSFNDLVGNDIAVVKDSAGAHIVSSNTNINLYNFDSAGAAVFALKIKKVDALFFDEDPCKYFMKYTDKLKIIYDGAVEEDYSIAVRKYSYELLSIIDNGINEIITNGFYDKLLDKYFN